ncbi:MAG TPA: lysoplasmalogenase [Acidimicrobiia bacterium]|nr:lysoplasmalogenase [Acidimicrobiia bacterium]
MTIGATIFLVVAGAFAIGDWSARAGARRRLEYVCKPATLVALILVAVTLDPVHSDVRVWFVVALVFSLAGDVFLMLPSDAFVAGLGAFLLAHVAYAIGLNLHTSGDWWWALPVVAVAGLLGLRLIRGIIASNHRALIVPVVAYVGVIAVMVASALASGNVVAAVGALVFMGSDALIGETRFVRPNRWAPVTIMVTYHLGQAGLVLSLLR